MSDNGGHEVQIINHTNNNKAFSRYSSGVEASGKNKKSSCVHINPMGDGSIPKEMKQELKIENSIPVPLSEYPPVVWDLEK
jgi:hypothetical protein